MSWPTSTRDQVVAIENEMCKLFCMWNCWWHQIAHWDWCIPRRYVESAFERMQHVTFCMIYSGIWCLLYDIAQAHKVHSRTTIFNGRWIACTIHSPTTHRTHQICPRQNAFHFPSYDILRWGSGAFEKRAIKWAHKLKRVGDEAFQVPFIDL